MRLPPRDRVQHPAHEPPQSPFATPAPAADLPAPPPLELEPDEVRLIDDELAHLASRRRLGGLLMYAPVIGLLFMMAAGVSGPASGPVGRAMLALGLTILVIGLPLAPLGMIMRLAFGYRLDRLAVSLDVDHLPADPPVLVGERLGQWRVVQSDSSQLRLSHEIGPGPIAHAVRFGVDAILVGVVTLGIVAAASSGQSGSWVGVAMLALLTVVLSAAVGGGFITIEHEPRDGPSPSSRPARITFSGHRIWGLFTAGGWQVDADRFSGLTVTDAAIHVITDGDGLRSIGGFGRGPYGRWQLRRLARQIAGERVRDAAPRPHASRQLHARQALTEPPVR